MGNIFYFLFIFELCVTVCISNDVNQATVSPQRTTRSLRYVADDCYTDRKYCEEFLNYVPKPTCVYQKFRGLINYFGTCQIRLQNCVIKHQQKYNDGSASLDDEIYYNGKTFNCQYYQEHTTSEKQAVTWYFKLGGRDPENEPIYTAVKPTGNIKAVP